MSYLTFIPVRFKVVALDLICIRFKLGEEKLIFGMKKYIPFDCSWQFCSIKVRSGLKVKIN